MRPGVDDPVQNIALIIQKLLGMCYVGVCGEMRESAKIGNATK